MRTLLSTLALAAALMTGCSHNTCCDDGCCDVGCGVGCSTGYGGYGGSYGHGVSPVPKGDMAPPATGGGAPPAALPADVPAPQ